MTHDGQRCATDANPTTMVWMILIFLVALWALCFSLHVAGSMIHALLVFAFVILLTHLLTGRKLA